MQYARQLELPALSSIIVSRVWFATSIRSFCKYAFREHFRDMQHAHEKTFTICVSHIHVHVQISWSYMGRLAICSWLAMRRPHLTNFAGRSWTQMICKLQEVVEDIECSKLDRVYLESKTTLMLSKYMSICVGD